MKLIESTSRIEMSGMIPNTPVSIYDALKSGEIKETKAGYEIDRNSVLAQTLEPTNESRSLDFASLIGQASPHYHTSSDPKDFLVVPVPMFITDVPNRNGVAFERRNVASFSPEHGMARYKTWVGKPTFKEHANDDITKAKGLILDTAINKLKNFPGFARVTALAAYDRTKDAQLHAEIAAKTANAYSMGAYVGHYECSLCGNKMTAGKSGCSHIDGQKVNFYAIPRKGETAKLIYKKAMDINGFELSSVATPAWRMAVSDYVTSLDPQLRDAK